MSNMKSNNNNNSPLGDDDCKLEPDLLKPGTGLLKRAQHATHTLTGHRINRRHLTQVPTLEEQRSTLQTKKSLSEHQMLFNEPFNQLSVVADHIGLTGAGGLVTERFEAFEEATRRSVQCVFNVTWEWPIFKTDNLESYRIPVADDKRENLFAYFDEVADKLDEVRAKGFASVVHCMGGVSRSTTLVIAYLMRSQKLNLREAFEHIKTVRRDIRPKVVFLEQLSQYEEKLRIADASTGDGQVRSMTKWISHTMNGVTRSLPEFIVENYLFQYLNEFRPVE